MTDVAPLWLAAPVVVFVCVVTTARWAFVNDTFVDRLVNWALTWVSIGIVFEECGAGTGYSWLTYRVFLGTGVLALGKIYGLATLFGGTDPQIAPRRQRIWDGFAALAAVTVTISGRPSEPAEPGFLWRTVVIWSVFSVPIIAASVPILRALVQGIRADDARRRERFVYSAFALAVVFWLYATAASGWKVLRGGASDSPGAYWTVSSCLIFFVVTLVSAVPLAVTLSVRVGWDRASRDCQKLLPLWRDLTATVPGIVLDSAIGGRGSESRTYRMAVEIQDALQHLKRYVPADETLDLEARAFARQMVRAAQRCSDGGPPVAASHERGGPIDLDAAGELRHLIDLARAWRAVRADVLSGENGHAGKNVAEIA